MLASVTGIQSRLLMKMHFYSRLRTDQMKIQGYCRKMSFPMFYVKLKQRRMRRLNSSMLQGTLQNSRGCWNRISLAYWFLRPQPVGTSRMPFKQRCPNKNSSPIVFIFQAVCSLLSLQSVLNKQMDSLNLRAELEIKYGLAQKIYMILDLSVCRQSCMILIFSWMVLGNLGLIKLGQALKMVQAWLSVSKCFYAACRMDSMCSSVSEKARQQASNMTSLNARPAAPLIPGSLAIFSISAFLSASLAPTQPWGSTLISVGLECPRREMEELATVLLVHAMLGLHLGYGLAGELEISIELGLHCLLGEPNRVVQESQQVAAAHRVHQHGVMLGLKQYKGQGKSLLQFNYFLLLGGECSQGYWLFELKFSLFQSGFLLFVFLLFMSISSTELFFRSAFISKMPQPMTDLCALCRDEFTLANPAFIITCCGHNACQKCVKRSITTQSTQIQCGQCRKAYQVDLQTLEEFPKNITILKKLKEAAPAAPNTDTSYQSQLIQSKHSVTSSNLADSNMKQNIALCPKHGKPLEIICTVDRGFLCAHCAIFGEHYNHGFKTLQEFETEIRQAKQIYEHFDLKKQINDQSIRGMKYKASIQARINNKKDAMVKQIKQRFQLLMEIVKDAQARAYEDIGKNFMKLQSHISKATLPQPQIQTQCHQWKSLMQSYLHTVHTAVTMQQKINVFYQRSRPNLSEGERILKSVEKTNQSIRLGIEEKIESMRLQFTSAIEGSIYNYASVLMDLQEIKTAGLVEIGSRAPVEREENLPEFRKSIKIQFVKTEIDDFGAKHDRKTMTSTTNFGRSPTNSSHYGLTKVKSNPKLLRVPLDKPETPKKSLTPPKNVRKEENIEQKRQQNKAFAQRMLSQFLKSTDTLDLTGCDLNDQQILHYINLAAAEKPIKCLKMCKNRLTSNGLNQMMDHLYSITNINLSHNSLSDEALNIFLDNRKNLPNLRIINLSHNKLNERKVKNKAEELKKIGIITTL